MTISVVTTRAYCARQTINGKEYAGVGFTHVDAMMNCLKAAERDGRVCTLA